MITTSTTFCSTINSIINVGAKPILVDVKADDIQINEKLIEKKITKRTKAILIVHLHGNCCNIDKIVKIKKKYNLVLIEDCAHSIEAKYKGKNVGTFGDFGCFSFYSNKNITTIEGGMLICKSNKVAKRAKILSLHGMSKDAYRRFSTTNFKDYDVIEPGYKYNLSDVASVLGLLQLKEINKKYKRRELIWRKYNKELASTKFILPYNSPNYIKPAYHIYYLRMPKNKTNLRYKIINELNNRGIGCGIHYKSIAQFSFYKHFIKNINKDFINSIEFGNSSISIPITPYLTNLEISKIINTIKFVSKKYL